MHVSLFVWTSVLGGGQSTMYLCSTGQMSPIWKPLASSEPLKLQELLSSLSSLSQGKKLTTPPPPPPLYSFSLFVSLLKGSAEPLEVQSICTDEKKILILVSY